MSFISKIFGNEETEFNEVRVDREVLDSVIYYSNQAFPNEFLALFDGKIKDKILYITGLIFLPGETCSTGAVFHSDMVPPTLKYWGSVHCHPGPSASPSGADLTTFSKHGVFHMIVCLPYSLETFRAYDKHGNPMDYTVGDYSYLVEDDDLDIFDEDDVLEDGETFEPGFFDEKDDDFFKQDEILNQQTGNNVIIEKDDDFFKQDELVNQQASNNVIIEKDGTRVINITWNKK